MATTDIDIVYPSERSTLPQAVPTNNLQSGGGGGWYKTNSGLAMTLCLAIVFFLLILIVTFICWRKKKKLKKCLQEASKVTNEGIYIYICILSALFYNFIALQRRLYLKRVYCIMVLILI